MTQREDEMLGTGSRLDRYELIDELGAGAFGVVYRGRHLDMGREDAIKVPHNARLARQFVTEGRLVAQLDHPNVVRVHAMNMQHDPPYIVYELVEGQSLRARMDEIGGPMDCDEVVLIARQVLEGLAVAHELGIIHRDLKPENILLRRDGVAKIADFGLGVAAEQMSMLASRSMSMGGDALASELGISRELGSDVGSSVAGTFAYMSPEQEDGLELDGRSDLFALGVLMYEAVTGARPRGRFKDPAKVNLGVSESLNDAIIAALESERADRPGDARSMGETIAPSDASSAWERKPVQAEGSLGQQGQSGKRMGTYRQTTPGAEAPELAIEDEVLREDLGLEVSDDGFDVLIPAGTRLPADVEQVYTTATDNQSTVQVHVCAGTSDKASRNRSVGQFYLAGIPPAPKGEPQIAVTFAVNREGRLVVTAVDRQSEGERQMTVEMV